MMGITLLLLHSTLNAFPHKVSPTPPYHLLNGRRYVVLLAGLANVSIPEREQSTIISAGVNGVLIAVDTPDGSQLGYISAFWRTRLCCRLRSRAARCLLMRCCIRRPVRVRSCGMTVRLDLKALELCIAGWRLGTQVESMLGVTLIDLEEEI